MHDPEPVAALVVAAGSGVRMGGEVPKALRLLAGEPLLLHAARRLVRGGATAVVVVARPADEPAVREALAPLAGAADVRVVHGGAERQDSVRLGLDVIAALDPVPPVVLVHDAARPLVDAATVARVVAAVGDGAAAVVPVVSVVDSIRQRTGTEDGTVGLDRSRLLAVQTPQGFDTATLVRAHAHVAAHGLAVTDDAGACEAVGVAVATVPGSATGLKITHPYDLVLAEAMLADLARAEPVLPEPVRTEPGNGARHE